jgi:hypothetical protein
MGLPKSMTVLAASYVERSGGWRRLELRRRVSGSPGVARDSDCKGPGGRRARGCNLQWGALSSTGLKRDDLADIQAGRGDVRRAMEHSAGACSQREPRLSALRAAQLSGYTSLCCLIDGGQMLLYTARRRIYISLCLCPIVVSCRHTVTFFSIRRTRDFLALAYLCICADLRPAAAQWRSGTQRRIGTRARVVRCTSFTYA